MKETSNGVCVPTEWWHSECHHSVGIIQSYVYVHNSYMIESENASRIFGLNQIRIVYINIALDKARWIQSFVEQKNFVAL